MWIWIWARERWTNLKSGRWLNLGARNHVSRAHANLDVYLFTVRLSSQASELTFLSKDTTRARARRTTQSDNTTMSVEKIELFNAFLVVGLCPGRRGLVRLVSKSFDSFLRHDTLSSSSIPIQFYLCRLVLNWL